MTYLELYNNSISSKETFWQLQAQNIAWHKSPTNILSYNQHQYHQWFDDGLVNMSYLCLDHQIAQGRGQQTALIYDSPVSQTKQQYTYQQLLDEVSTFAGALQNLGIIQGDTVVIYMPMIPQAVISMLACARLGAIHSVVFGGFAPHELSLRIDDAKPKIIISASYGIEGTRKIEYKPLLDNAVALANHKPQYHIFYQRPQATETLNHTNELNFDTIQKNAKPADCTFVPSTHPLYVLYTSGTTGMPKGIVRDTGGYATALKFSMDTIYHAKPGDVYWAASDVGWVVGHSYIVYGPLLQGCTTILYEGKPVGTPDAGAFWRMIQEYKINILFTAPTAIRAIKKEDSEAVLYKKYNTESLRYLFLAGERCDPATLHWISDILQKPVIDHWWQTESGWPMLGISMGIEPKPTKAGSAGMPICGFDIQIINEEAEPLPPGQEGIVVVKLPLPPGCLTSLWQNHDRYHQDYLKPYPGYYLTGDGGYKDEEGYTYIMGRIDDVINVSGHRLSTGEMEEIVSTHTAVAECAVVGIDDSLRGQRPIAFVVLKDGMDTDNQTIENDIIALIREKIGAIAFLKNVYVLKKLPKTRSGKILRKNIRGIVDKKDYKVPGTIEDLSVLDDIKKLFA